MPRKRLKLVKSVPQVDRRYKNSEPLSSSLTTRSNLSTIKQIKKAQLAKKKEAEKVNRLSGEPTKEMPPHQVSHMLPFFYPSDYEDESIDEYDEHDVPRHLVSHMTPYCYPISGTFDDEDTLSSQSDIVVPPHLEQHVSLYCQPLDDNGSVVDWSTNDDNKRPKKRRTNFVPRHLESHVVIDNFGGDSGEVQLPRPGICCDMTRDHANMRDSLFPEDDDKPVLKRVGGRRPVANCVDLFEESKPKPRPMCITIVDREPENTKENIFGTGAVKTSRARRRWENDTKNTIFNVESDGEQTPTPTRRSSRYENTQEKLFGDTYGIKEAQEEYLRRRRVREDTQMTLFGPPTTPTPQRPQSAQSLTSTHENLFGMKPPSMPNRIHRLKRENTFDNLFGSTEARPFNASETEERYTSKNPKLVQDSLTQVLSCDDPRHGPAPPSRRVRKPVDPAEAYRRRPETVRSPITHKEELSAARVTGPCDAHWNPTITCCRRRNLSTWDTVNTITGESLPYSLSEQTSQQRDAWVRGKIQDSVAPPPSSRPTSV